MNYNPHENNPEAREKRAQRAALRNATGDPLRERGRIDATLRESKKYWPAVNAEVPIKAIYRHPGLRRRAALQSVRQHIDAKMTDRKARYAADMRESARKHAEKKALAKAGPMPLFDQVAA